MSDQERGRVRIFDKDWNCLIDEHEQPGDMPSDVIKRALAAVSGTDKAESGEQIDVCEVCGHVAACRMIEVASCVRRRICAFCIEAGPPAAGGAMSDEPRDEFGNTERDIRLVAIAAHARGDYEAERLALDRLAVMERQRLT